jgi:RNA polymerase sigma-70 factor, ECF subfamily
MLELAYCETERTPIGYAGSPDDELMARAGSGDRAAFDALVVRHGSFALRAAARLSGDRAAAQDIAQDALVRAWTGASGYDPRRASLRTWLYRIVMNLCIDYRRQARPQQLPAHFDLIDPAISGHALLEDLERRASLGHAMRDLPLRQRAALDLVYEQGLSAEQAGRVLGASAKAIERLLSRARHSLRLCLRLEPVTGGPDADT